MMKVTALLITALLFCQFAGPPAIAADSSEFTVAEKQLFVTPHLAGLVPPTRLQYLVSRRGSLQKPFDDHATLTLSRENGGIISRVSYLSGPEKLELPPFPGMEGNPVLLHFLEREIREMRRLTGGSVNYYRKRIRMALATDPQVENIRIEHQGRTLAATRIRISPYLDDPARSRYEKFATRHYAMVLSQEIPGGIVSLHSELHEPGKPADQSGLLWSETVSFETQQ